MQRINYEFNSLGPFVRAAAAIIEGQSLVCVCMCVGGGEAGVLRPLALRPQANGTLTRVVAEKGEEESSRRGWRGAVRGAGKWQSQQMCNGHNFLNAQT